MLLLALLLAQAPAPPAAAGDDAAPAVTVEAIAEELAERRDAADPELIRRLAGVGTLGAAEKLVECYELFSTLHMRWTTLRALGLFDGVPVAEPVALGKLLDVASASPTRELREEAVRTLAGCLERGRAYLAMLVESEARDEVRELAMEYHAAEPRAADGGWYRALWDRRTAGAESAVRVPQRVRALGFGAVASSLGTDDVYRGLHDRNGEVRLRALRELTWREVPELRAIAEGAFGAAGEWVEVRAAGADALQQLDGAEAVERWVREGARARLPFTLRMHLAKLVAGELTPALERRVVALVRDRDRDVRLFALEALAGRGGVRADEAVRGRVGDGDPLVCAAACRAVAERGDRSAIPALEAVLRRNRAPGPVGAAFDALASLRAGERSWREQLVAHATGGVEVVRNAALRELARSGTRPPLDLLRGALDHASWSTRVAAIRALEDLRSEYAVGVLVLYLARAEGRLKREAADALTRSTGRAIGPRPEAWRRWWIEELGRFRLPDATERARLEREARVQHQRRRTRAAFFGIRIESHRVAFVIDTSGSMAERTRGRYVDEPGPPRLEVAVRELRRALSALDRRSFFNIVSFDDEVRPWRRRAVEFHSEHLAAADAHARRLVAGSSTDLYGGLSAALDDPAIDTVYLLSDGEPAGAPVTDVRLVRRLVAERNAHRGVVIHTVAVGGRLPLMEWLAEDSGGTHVRVR